MGTAPELVRPMPVTRIASPSCVNITDSLLRCGIWALLGKSHRLVENILDPAIDRLCFSGSQDAHVLEISREGGKGIAAFPHRELFLRAVKRFVVLRMPVPAVGFAFDQSRAGAIPRPAAGPLDRLINGEHIVAVDGD